MTSRRQADELIHTHNELELEQLGPEVSALLDAARDLASTRDLRPLLDVLLDHVKRLVEYAGTSIWELHGDELMFLGFRSPRAFDPEVAHTVRFDTRRMGEHRSRLARGASRFACRTSGRSRMLPACFKKLLVAAQCGHRSRSSRRSCAYRLVVRDGPIGRLSLTGPRLDAFSQRDATLALAIAQQAAVAIENPRLHERAGLAAVLEERQRLGGTLHIKSSAGLGTTIRVEVPR